MADPITVALFSGGKSTEREVSLNSGNSVEEALNNLGYNVVRLDPANQEDLVKAVQMPLDVAFLVTHGKWGEDGCLQGFLETIGLPYTGSGVLASATAMNKSNTKMIYETAGVPTAPSFTVKAGKAYDVAEITAIVGQHCMVKAACGGSTIGIYESTSEAELGACIEKALAEDDVVLIERFVKGAEYTAAVVGGKNARALPVIQIIPKNEYYDFESKYAPGGSQHLCPAPLDEETTARMQGYSLAAHKALGCAGATRTDFIMEPTGEMWALETNTLPGMTATSLLPDAARALGISFEGLCDLLIKEALEEKAE